MTFVKSDTSTSGSWKGVYGSDGYNVINDTSATEPNYPGYATVTPSGNNAFTWTASTTNTQALQWAAAGSMNRVAACWYNSTSQTINLNLTDGKTHQVALYLLDYDASGRAENVSIAVAGTVVNTQSVSGFSRGVYEVWDISGSVAITISRTGGANCVVSGLFFDSVPAAPTGLAATGGNAQVTLSWTGSPGATSYNIYRGTSAGGEAATAIKTGVTGTSYTDSTATNGTTYYYQVTAVNAVGEGAKSNEASATPVLPVPSAPSNLTAVGGNGQATLSWTTAATATSYNVYEGMTSGGEAATPVATGIAGTSKTITGLTNGTTYYFEVTAVDGAGESGKSNEASTTPATGPSATATFVKTDTSTSGGWKGVYGADGYNVINDTSATEPNYPAYATVTPIGNTAHTWATSITSTQALQWAASGSTNRIAACWFNATSQTIHLDLTDGKVHQVALYLLDYDNGGRAESVSIADAGTNVVLNTQTASSFTQGVYKVWSISGNVNITITTTSGVNNVISGLFFDTIPGAPANLTATAGVSQVALSWSVVGNATSYKVYRGTTSGGEGSTAITTGVTGSTYKDTSVTNGTTYYYTVSAVNTVGEGANSNEASATPYTLTSLTVPSTIASDSTASGTDSLNCSPLTTDIDVALYSSSPAVTIAPNTVTINAGSTGAGFTLSAATVTTSTPVTITDNNGASATITVLPATVPHFVVTAPSWSITGVPFNFTVQAVDGSGNPLSSYSGIVHFTSLNNDWIGLPPDSSITGGFGQFSATFYTCVPENISVTDVNQPGMTGTSDTILVEDYSISASAQQVSIVDGSTAQDTVTVTTRGGSSFPVGFTVSGCPPGIFTQFSPPTVTGDGSSTLTFTATAAAAPGSYPITISGISGSAVRSTSITLNVSVLSNEPVYHNGLYVQYSQSSGDSGGPYYNFINTDDPVVGAHQVEPDVDTKYYGTFPPGHPFPYHPYPEDLEYTIQTVWWGYVIPQYSETYTFSASPGDTSQYAYLGSIYGYATVSVGGQQVFLSTSGFDVYGGTPTPIALKAGVPYPIYVGRSDDFDFVVQLDWQSPSQAFGLVPSSQLWYSLPSTPSAPTVAKAAAASPNPVTGTTTNLSVLGADANGESNLAYSWRCSDPSAVTFSDNYENSAKNCVATFSKAGTYTFFVTITNLYGHYVESSVVVTVDATLTAINVYPANVDCAPNSVQPFTAVAVDQFGNPLATQPTFTWSVDLGGVGAGGVGTIDQSGNYSAGANAGTATVRAAVGAISGTASVIVSPSGPGIVNPAAADPNPVPGLSTNLTALGSDPAGESTLTYTWEVTTFVPVSGAPGPGTVSYSDNDTNTAKNTVATFSQAGTYLMTVTLADSSGITATSSVSVTVDQTPTSAVVNPRAVTLDVNQTQAFTAAFTDQFGNAIAGTVPVTWSVAANGAGGTIDQSGNYTAPGIVGTDTVTAQSGTAVGTATVTVSGGAITIPQPAGANPNPVTGATTQLTVLGSDAVGGGDLKYTWSATGPAAVSYSDNNDNTAQSTTATFTQAGTYTFTVTIGNSSGSVTSSVLVLVQQTLTSIVVSPSPVSVSAGATQQFQASPFDQFGRPFYGIAPLNWWVTGNGAVDQAGNYTAPSTTGTDTVNVSSGSVTGSASVTIVTSVPVITSAPSATAIAGSFFTYQITATNFPTSFSATGPPQPLTGANNLPSWLNFDPGTGVLSGTPTSAETDVIDLGATNSAGTGTSTLTITVYPSGPPVITSATTASTTVGTELVYQITATNNPTSYSATGPNGSALPSWLTIDASTGVLRGTPTSAETDTIFIGAKNAAGNDGKTLTITVLQPGILSGFTLSEPVIHAPQGSLATVTLSAPAGPGGVVVQLSSNNPTVARPYTAAVQITAGSSSQTVVICTTRSSFGTATISAELNGVIKTAVLNVNPERTLTSPVLVLQLPMCVNVLLPQSQLGGLVTATTSMNVGSVNMPPTTASLSISGLPTGISASFSPTSVQAGSSSSGSNLTLSMTTGSVWPGVYETAVSASGGGQTDTGTLNVVVPPTNPGLNFSISSSVPSANMGICVWDFPVGSTESSTISLNAPSGFTDIVSLSLIDDPNNPILASAQSPNGISWSLDTSELTVNAPTANLSITVGASVPRGEYNLAISAHGSEGTVTVPLVINVVRNLASITSLNPDPMMNGTGEFLDTLGPSDIASLHANQVATPTYTGANGNDDRVPVLGDVSDPNSTSIPYAKARCLVISYFVDGTTGRGSGTMVGYNHVLTAAHVLFNPKTGNEAYEVEVDPEFGVFPLNRNPYPGEASGGEVPQFGSAFVKDNGMHLGPNFNPNVIPLGQMPADDYALLDLKPAVDGWNRGHPLGEATSYIQMAADFIDPDQGTEIAGYPAQIYAGPIWANGGGNGTFAAPWLWWSASGNGDDGNDVSSFFTPKGSLIPIYDPLRVFYTIDQSEGDSGSGLVHTSYLENGNPRTVYAVVSFNYNLYSINAGTLITTDRFCNVLEPWGINVDKDECPGWPSAVAMCGDAVPPP